MLPVGEKKKFMHAQYYPYTSPPEETQSTHNTFARKINYVYFLYSPCIQSSFKNYAKYMYFLQKAATQMEQLLGRGSITEVIDSNTAQGKGSGRLVTWDVVLKVIFFWYLHDINVMPNR